MKNAILVKVTEKTSGNSYTQKFDSLERAREFSSFVNGFSSTSSSSRLQAEILPRAE